ncbi:MAG: DUF2017 family protein [Ilumatobacteraceae bacterium]
MIRRRRPPAPIERTGDGYVINVEAPERDLLERLLGELTQLLTTDTDVPALRRAFPPAYHLPGDEESEAEYQRLMRDELVASRLDALTTVSAALREHAVLDEAGLGALMQSLNALRLVLGTMLDVDEEHDLDDVSPDDPLVGEHQLYGYLSYLLDAAVRAATAA